MNIFDRDANLASPRKEEDCYTKMKETLIKETLIKKMLIKTNAN